MALQRIVDYYSIIESGMIMTIDIGFGNCQS